MIDQDPIRHRKDPKFKIGYPSPSYDSVDTTIESIKEILALSNQHGFKVVLLINPIYERTFKTFKFDLFKNFISKLSDISRFYSFISVREITTDPYFYYETSHFRPMIAEWMLKSIRNENIDKKITDPFWGIKIDKSNVGYYLTEIEKRYLQPIDL